MAFNPDDKVQWENLAPTLQALVAQKIQEGSKQYFDTHISSYIGRAIETSNKYTDAKAAALQTLINKNGDAITKLTTNNQTEFTELKNSYSNLNGRLDGNEFVKSKDKANKIELKYEAKDGETEKSLHAYVDGAEVPLGAGGLAGNIKFIERPDITTAKSATKTGHSTPQGDDESGSFWRTIIWEDGWYQMHGYLAYDDGAAVDPNGNPIDILPDIPIYLKKNSTLEHNGDLYYFTNTIRYATIVGELIESKNGSLIAGTPYMDAIIAVLNHYSSSKHDDVRSYYVTYSIPVYMKYNNTLIRHDTIVLEKVFFDIRTTWIPSDYNNPNVIKRAEGWYEINPVRKPVFINTAKGKMRNWTDNLDSGIPYTIPRKEFEYQTV